jgi:hypothetical protein
VRTVEKENNNTIYSITDARKNTLEERKRRYMQLMFLRALMVPGVLVLPLPLEIKIPLVALAAVAQFVAVISANTPEQGSPRPETFISERIEITK